MPNTPHVYMIKCLKTGTSYVGGTKHLRQRINQHITSLDRGDHPNREMQADYFKYPNYFVYGAIETADVSTVFDKERYFLATYAGPVYNGALVGINSPTYSEYKTNRQQIAARATLRKATRNRVLTEEQVIDIRKRYASGQTITEIASIYGRKRTSLNPVILNHTFKREAYAPQIKKNNHNRKIVYDPLTGIFYESQAELAKLLGIGPCVMKYRLDKNKTHYTRV